MCAIAKVKKYEKLIKNIFWTCLMFGWLMINNFKTFFDYSQRERHWFSENIRPLFFDKTHVQDKNYLFVVCEKK